MTPKSLQQYKREMEIALEACRIAGNAVMPYFDCGQYTVREKSRGNPVTSADLEVNRKLKEVILQAFRDDGWLSEEEQDSSQRLGKRRVWIVDPIDGTKEFIEKVPEFSISLALVVDGEPQAAVVFNPAKKEIFTAQRGGGTFANEKRVQVSSLRHLQEGLILASRSDYEQGKYRDLQAFFKLKPIGSIAYRLAQVAAGLGEGTFTLKDTSEWDVCAGCLLVEEAGGVVTNEKGLSLKFNQPDVRIGGVLAANPSLHGKILKVLRNEAGTRWQNGQMHLLPG
jgi:myo-inositol-1(or 4)-monophosphatase